MRQFSFFHALYLSFFSKALYQDVGRQWKGIGFLYLLFLLAAAWLPAILQMHFALARFASEAAPQFLRDLPRITITNGVVVTDPPGPHIFKDPETGKPFMIIDTSVDLPNLDELEGDAVYLTRSKLVMLQERRGQTRIHDLSGVREFEVTREDVEEWVRVAASIGALVLYPFLLVFSWVYRIVQALLYGAIGLAFARGASPPLEYGTLLRLAAVAVTPAVLVDTAKDLAGLTIPFWWLICFLVAMAYLHFAVEAAKEQPAIPPQVLNSPPGIA
jgi:hypothetical protein